MRILTTLISLVAIFLVPSSVPNAADISPVTQAIITTGVTSSAQPQTDNLSIIDSTIGYVTFYTEINGLNGEVVEHQWLYEHQEISSVAMVIESNKSLNWSQSTISPSQVGQWEARVVDQSGNILAIKHFDVIESSRGIQQVMQKQVINSCAVKLAELEEQIAEHPTVDYYRFLYNKQAERCQ